MTEYTVKSKGVDEVSVLGFGELTHFEAAEIVGDDGWRACVFLEPQERQEGWDREEEWRQAVREIAKDLAYEGSDEYYLVFDPARDQQEEEVLQ